jgi:hypothetical protein
MKLHRIFAIHFNKNSEKRQSIWRSNRITNCIEDREEMTGENKIYVSDSAKLVVIRGIRNVVREHFIFWVKDLLIRLSLKFLTNNYYIFIRIYLNWYTINKKIIFLA